MHFLKDLKTFFARATAAEKAFAAMTPDVKAATIQTISDVLAFVAVADAAGASKGLNFELDAQVIAIAKQLYSDAERDVQQAKVILAALGVPVKPIAPAVQPAA